MFDKILETIKTKYNNILNISIDDTNINNNFSSQFDKFQKHRQLGNYYVLFLIEQINKYNINELKDASDLNKDIIYFLEANLSYNNYDSIAILFNSKEFSTFSYKYNHIYNLLYKASNLYTPNLFEYLDFNSNNIFKLIINNSYLLHDGKQKYYLKEYINIDNINKNEDSILNNTMYLLKNYDKSLIKSNIPFILLNSKLNKESKSFINKNIYNISYEYYKLYDTNKEQINQYIKLVKYVKDTDTLLLMLVNSKINYLDILNKIKDENIDIDYTVIKYLEYALDEINFDKVFY